MNILVLNGSPHPNGNTVAMINAFAEGAREKGHSVEVINIYGKKITGCLGCEYCHNNEYGICVQKDDMLEIYEALESTEVMILASPMYFHNISGPLQSVISRIYAMGKLKHLKKCGMLLSSRIDGIYAGITEIHRTTVRIMGVEDIGIITSVGDENSVAERRKEIIEAGIVSGQVNEEKSKKKLEEIREFGRNL
ncbi:flavodoxin family protein [Clostridium oryzae]|uniref:NADPH-dependent FMN reductase n=1 Tax=Clostridium oryzae TaxID=1450648 RepID=A0A1V4IZ88_9CLOT|nr:flavodoxin family protein [Clostridium oryzae]OPJ65203.1 NADPH-dependent FMN reductase [Clostridium oryzae]